MSAILKLCLLAFAVPLILFSCAAPQRDIAVTPVPSASLSTITPMPPAVTITASPKLVPKQNDLIFVEFFAGTWMECRQMEPIVRGLKKKYSSCMRLERVNYHEWTSWHDLLFPFGSPEFVLLDSSGQVLFRWFGLTTEEEFSVVLDPLCSG